MAVLHTEDYYPRDRFGLSRTCRLCTHQLRSTVQGEWQIPWTSCRIFGYAVPFSIHRTILSPTRLLSRQEVITLLLVILL